MISDRVQQDFKAHALSEYPREACGVVVADSYIPCTNQAASPKEHFIISAQEMARIAIEHGRVQAILHSHPFDRRAHQRWPASWPSHQDMVAWLEGDVPWGIGATEGEGMDPLVWLDEGTIAPLEGREFVHGVWDCYAAVRDWYRVEKGLRIRNYPRAMEWWERGQDHYGANFRAAGFVEVPRDDLQPGDACLMQVRSPVVNHAAVYVGDNKLFHHLIKRLSGFDSFNKWERVIVKYVRYVGEPNA